MTRFIVAFIVTFVVTYTAARISRNRARRKGPPGDLKRRLHSYDADTLEEYVQARIQGAIKGPDPAEWGNSPREARGADNPPPPPPPLTRRERRAAAKDLQDLLRELDDDESNDD